MTGQPWGAAPALTDQDRRKVRDAFTAIADPGDAGEHLADPTVVAVARHALVAALARRGAALPRPISLFRGYKKRNGKDGEAYARTECWTVQQLGAWFKEQSQEVRPKGIGLFVVCGDANGRRRDQDCRAITWLIVECDETGDWHQLLDTLDILGAAYVACRSPSHTVENPRWRLLLPLASPWVPSGDLGNDKARWKGQLYPAARLVLGAVAGLSQEGFDPSTDSLLNRAYPPYRRPERKDDPPREVRIQDGVAFDIEALFDAVDALGCAPRGRRRSDPCATGQTSEAPADAPEVIAAFAENGLLLEQINEDKWACVCPWESKHTSGARGDTSTVVFRTGVFYCSHAHCRKKLTTHRVLTLLHGGAAERAKVTQAQTRAERRIREQMRPKQARIDRATAYQHIVDGIASIQKGEAVQDTSTMGVGKSHAETRAAVARAEQGLQTILLAKDHDTAIALCADIESLGVRPRYAKGILAYKNPDGSPVCRYAAAVEEAQARGTPARPMLCRGQWEGLPIGPPCEYLGECDASTPYEGDAESLIVVSVYHMAPLLIEDHPEALVILDEPPGEDINQATLTPD